MTKRCANYRDEILRHYYRNWGANGRPVSFQAGPIHELPDAFSILEFEPRRNRNMWTYATCCMSQPNDPCPLELHLFSSEQSEEPVEVLLVTAHYHRTARILGLGHSVNFGKPWVANSTCEYGLLSRPYLDGPELEHLALSSGSIVDFLWLIPVTKPEIDFRKTSGLEALERRFEECQLNYIDPNRVSVC